MVLPTETKRVPRPTRIAPSTHLSWCGQIPDFRLWQPYLPDLPDAHRVSADDHRPIDGTVEDEFNLWHRLRTKEESDPSLEPHWILRTGVPIEIAAFRVIVECTYSWRLNIIVWIKLYRTHFVLLFPSFRLIDSRSHRLRNTIQCNPCIEIQFTQTIAIQRTMFMWPVYISCCCIK